MYTNSIRLAARYTSRRTVLFGVIALLGVLPYSPLITSARAGNLAPEFGPNGEAGEINGFPILFGTSGSIFELEAFVHIADGSTNLSAGLPDPLTQLEFRCETILGGSGLQLTYRFKNGGSAQIANASFFFFVDPEIAGDVDYTNEYGIVTGTAGHGSGDSAPDSWEIDEPGFESGNLYNHLLSGTLGNSNSVPSAHPQDVAMALGFDLGTLNPTDMVEVRITLSDTPPNNGGFTLTTRDVTNVNDSLSLFGTATVDRGVPEPNAAVLIAALASSIALSARMRRTGDRSRIVWGTDARQYAISWSHLTTHRSLTAALTARSEN